LLQRQLGAGLHGDALDLIAMSLLDRFIEAPWAVDAARAHRDLALLLLEPLHQALHFLVVVLARHQYDIVGRHHDQVLDSDGGDQGPFAAQVAVAAVLADRLAHDDVAGAIMRSDAPYYRPGPQVVPA